jgi:hypothetical protein
MDLRKLFGPSQEEIWQQLARELQATFTTGGFTRPMRMQARVGTWTVTLESHTAKGLVCTQMRAAYVNPEGFRFAIYRGGLFSDIGKVFGLQDIEVGDPELDRDFIIQGNDSAKLKSLFVPLRIRDLIKAQPSISLQLRGDEGWFGEALPEGVDQLWFAVAEGIVDIDRLRQLYDLFGEVLQRLGHLGSAYENDPTFSAS